MGQWTYAGMPFLNPPTMQSYIDSVRFLIGDTDTTDQQILDGEIIGLLCQNSNQSTNAFTTPPVSVSNFPTAGVIYNPYEAAITACTTLAAKYSRLAGSMSVGDLSISKGNIAQAYRDMIPVIRAQAMRQFTPIPYGAGMLISEEDMDKSNDDLRPPQFEVGMDDNPDGSPSVLGGTVGFSQAVPSG